MTRGAAAAILSAHRQSGCHDGGRYAHAKQFNRHHRQLRLLRTRLGRIIRDIRRKIASHADLEEAIKRELRRRSAVEPVIGHMKSERPLGGCHLKGHAGDAANAILTAVGHNFRLILAWLRALLRPVLSALWRTFPCPIALNSAS